MRRSRACLPSGSGPRSAPNASSPIAIALTRGEIVVLVEVRSSASMRTEVSSNGARHVVLDAVVAEEQVVRVAIAVPLLDVDGEADVRSTPPGTPGRCARRFGSRARGTRSATAVPLRVMTKLSPASTRRMISALSLRSWRWPMVSGMRTTVAQSCYADVRTPCRLHVAVQPTGVTCTTIRRAQSGQYRGGSSSRRAAQRSWPSAAAGSPHWSQNTTTIITGCR